MTRSRIATVLAALAVVVACAVIGRELWDTTVPDGLQLPAVSQDEFDAGTVAEAEEYEAVARILTLVSMLVLVVVLALYVRRGPGLARESAAGPIGTGFMLGILGLGIAWLVQIPFNLASFWWARKYDVVEENYADWFFGEIGTMTSTSLTVSVVLLVVMGFARLVGSAWFAPAAGVLAALILGLSFVQPWLFGSGLDRAPRDIRIEAQRLADREKLPDVPIKVEEVSELTDQPNAYAFGLGPSRRVVLWDTLVDNYSDEEVRVVLAHELGHHEHRHLVKQVWWLGIFALAAGFVVALVTRRKGSLAGPAAVPLALLVFTVLQFATMPLSSTWSRRMEAEADWTALQATRDPTAMEELFRGFADDFASDPDPPGWWETIFASHPNEADRIAMARAWRERQR